MGLLVFLILLEINGAVAVTHSLKYFYTGSSGVSNFPEFVSVGLVDDVEISHCDSYTNRNEPRQDWMNKVTEDDPHYWNDLTVTCKGAQQVFRDNIKTAKQRFNQTGGVHIFQQMYGCEFDDETEEVTGYQQFGYDGEDFISLDLKTETWVAPVQQAVITKNKWNNKRAQLAQLKNYHTQQCVDWLKKYVNYGRSSLMRTDVPSVSLLQKSPSSPVSCHATGFYPDRATMFWRKDGLELHEDVGQGEILPNHDGTFQMSVDLKPSSPEDWSRYDCVFQLHGLKDDIVIKLDEAVIRTNASDKIMIIIIAVVVVALVTIIGGVGFFIYKKKNKVEEETKKKDEEQKKKIHGGSHESVSSGGSHESDSSVGSETLLLKKSC